jgi:hypothetical protein
MAQMILDCIGAHACGLSKITNSAEWKSAQSKHHGLINMTDRRPPTSMEVVNFCSPQLNVPHPLVDCRNGIARIAIEGFQSFLNFMVAGVLLPEKFDDTSLFNFVEIDIINLRNADKRPMSVKTSQLSLVK